MSQRTRSQILNSGQLAMFMTPGEIHERYQPLDADRLGSESEHYTTRTPHSETRGHGHMTPSVQGTGQEKYYFRHRGSERGVTISRIRPESDEELWGRKYEESQMSPEERYQEHGVSFQQKYIGSAGQTTARSGAYHRTQRWTEAGARSSHFTSHETYQPYETHPEGGPSLAEHMTKHGMPGLISLGSPEGSMGSMGKPQIVGGHHRLAVATRHMSDQFLPVMHFQDIKEARSKSLGEAGYRYT